MDRSTLDVYDAKAVDFAAEWEDEQPDASDLHELVTRFFAPGPTLDVGCGSGRDTAWLHANGFDARGIDGSPALLEQARSRHPGIRFSEALLPVLEGLPEGQFTNVYCETVIMHLPASEIPAAVRRMVSLVAPGGNLYLSWRVTAGEDVRDAKGRLYSAFPVEVVREALDGMSIKLDAQQVSTSSAKVVHRIVAART